MKQLLFTLLGLLTFGGLQAQSIPAGELYGLGSWMPTRWEITALS